MIFLSFDYFSMDFYCKPSTSTERGSDNGFQADSQDRSTCRSSAQPRPSILRGRSSYGPDRHPMETFRPCIKANTKLNSHVKPLAPHYSRNENVGNRYSMPRGVSLDCDLSTSSLRGGSKLKQDAALALQGTRLKYKTNVDHFTTHIPRQEPGTSPSRQTVDSGFPSNVSPPESSSEG